ncbi:hypothetical protein GPECTOR_109g209 [Gonium pectorale]|uniref:Uncharacterized protein n=1 Tax=Gonium pectorale TaxID=33097 RepID=A0A150FZC0_GONPE|nr:hypothetical protein GPECTOR_109g209 [Gonium pectorale]|eukprot:KXZ42966.1 hypothetical protein GPECTOR_109g209 [Gonium pectorale]
MDGERADPDERPPVWARASGPGAGEPRGRALGAEPPDLGPPAAAHQTSSHPEPHGADPATRRRSDALREGSCGGSAGGVGTSGGTSEGLSDGSSDSLSAASDAATSATTPPQQHPRLPPPVLEPGSSLECRAHVPPQWPPPPQLEHHGSAAGAAAAAGESPYGSWDRDRGPVVSNPHVLLVAPAPPQPHPYPDRVSGPPPEAPPPGVCAGRQPHPWSPPAGQRTGAQHPGHPGHPGQGQPAGRGRQCEAAVEPADVPTSGDDPPWAAAWAWDATTGPGTRPGTGPGTGPGPGQSAEHAAAAPAGEGEGGAAQAAPWHGCGPAQGQGQGTAHGAGIVAAPRTVPGLGLVISPIRSCEGSLLGGGTGARGASAAAAAAGPAVPPPPQVRGLRSSTSQPDQLPAHAARAAPDQQPPLLVQSFSQRHPETRPPAPRRHSSFIAAAAATAAAAAATAVAAANAVVTFIRVRGAELDGRLGSSGGGGGGGDYGDAPGLYGEDRQLLERVMRATAFLEPRPPVAAEAAAERRRGRGSQTRALADPAPGALSLHELQLLASGEWRPGSGGGVCGNDIAGYSGGGGDGWADGGGGDAFGGTFDRLPLLALPACGSRGYGAAQEGASAAWTEASTAADEEMVDAFAALQPPRHLARPRASLIPMLQIPTAPGPQGPGRPPHQPSTNLHASPGPGSGSGCGLDGVSQPPLPPHPLSVLTLRPAPGTPLAGGSGTEPPHPHPPSAFALRPASDASLAGEGGASPYHMRVQDPATLAAQHGAARSNDGGGGRDLRVWRSGSLGGADDGAGAALAEPAAARASPSAAAGAAGIHLRLRPLGSVPPPARYVPFDELDAMPYDAAPQSPAPAAAAPAAGAGVARASAAAPSRQPPNPVVVWSSFRGTGRMGGMGAGGSDGSGGCVMGGSGNSSGGMSPGASARSHAEAGPAPALPPALALAAGRASWTGGRQAEWVGTLEPPPTDGSWLPPSSPSPVRLPAAPPVGLWAREAAASVLGGSPSDHRSSSSGLGFQGLSLGGGGGGGAVHTARSHDTVAATGGGGDGGGSLAGGGDGSGGGYCSGASGQSARAGAAAADGPGAGSLPGGGPWLRGRPGGGWGPAAEAVRTHPPTVVNVQHQHRHQLLHAEAQLRQQSLLVDEGAGGAGGFSSVPVVGSNDVGIGVSGGAGSPGDSGSLSLSLAPDSSGSTGGGRAGGGGRGSVGGTGSLSLSLAPNSLGAGAGAGADPDAGGGGGGGGGDH